MAVSSSGKKEKKQKKVGRDKTRPTNSTGSPHRRAARKKSPGVRFLHNRIYDSQNGKTCHQCRQKTLDFAAKCKGKTENKQCTFYFCHKCLLNRYGEKAEDVAMLVDWLCPKCRGICNCSFCMKKRGQLPTGVLCHAAKAKGFASVSDMLHLNIQLDKSSDAAAPLKEQKDADEEPGPVLTRRCSNRNSVKSPAGSMQLEEKKSGNGRKVKRSSIDVNGGNACVDNNSTGFSTRKTGHRKHQISKEESEEGEMVHREAEGDQLIKINSDNKFPGKHSSEPIESNCVEPEFVDKNPAETSGYHKNKNMAKMKSRVSNVKTLLPKGILLNNVATINFPTEDAGHALQFLEFCEAFGEVLNLKKGHSKMLLRELANGAQKRRTRNATVVQFHIQLLSMIQNEFENEYSSLSQNMDGSSWFKVVREYIAETKYPLKQLLFDSSHTHDGGYDQLNSSQKLRILNFLCDEALGTLDFRKLIEEQNLTFVERRKKARHDQKEKERNLGKEMKKKLQDETAKAILMKNGAPLSIAEHDALVSRIKLEVAQTLDVASTLANTLGSSDSAVEERRLDAVRSEPISSEGSSYKFWSLRGYTGDIDILLQAIENPDSSTCKERWYTFGTEHRAIIEDYVSSSSVLYTHRTIILFPNISKEIN